MRITLLVLVVFLLVGCAPAPKTGEVYRNLETDNHWTVESLRSCDESSKDLCVRIVRGEYKSRRSIGGLDYMGWDDSETLPVEVFLRGYVRVTK